MNMPRGRRGTASFVRGNCLRRGQGSPGRQRIRRHKPDTIDLKICRQRARDALRSGLAAARGRGGKKPIKNKKSEIAPPLTPESAPPRITFPARGARGWPLEFEVAASDGSIEATEEPNVFLWHGPKSPRRRRTVLGRRARGGPDRTRPAFD